MSDADPTGDLTDALTLTIAGLRYTCDRAPKPGGGRVVVSVQVEDGSGTPLRDRVDLYGFKTRERFAGLVASLFGRQHREAAGQLAVLLDQIERARAVSEGTRTAAPADHATILSGARRAQAVTLLGQVDLLERAAAAIEGLGYVGEPRAKRLAFLVATSRLLARPLSAIVLAPSGAGKSELLEVVARLLPDEGRLYLSRISPAALYYAGRDALRHKLVVVDEQAGSAEADYAVRSLQSKGYLRLAIPGNGRTRQFETRGPIALFSSTTSSVINPENLSRCLRLTLDDSPAQTRRVQAAQRTAWTGKPARQVDLVRWQDAQRLLEPLDVVIPYAERLTFPAGSTCDRRGNQKLLGLVAAHALLFQHQRDRDALNRLVATRNDYAAIHALLAPDLTEEVGGLSPRAARVYRLLGQGGSATRRELSTQLGCCFNTVARALQELRAQELVTTAEAGPPARFRLLDRSILGCAEELLAPGLLS